MNKITLFFTILIAGFVATANAQADSTNALSKKNEIKIGAIKLLAGGIIEATYERIHSEDFTYGASVLVSADRKSTDFPEDFSLTPFARFYFTEPKHYGARGFFVEGFGKFIAGHDYTGYTELVYTDVDEYGNTYYRYNDKRESYTAAAVGISLGWKWINRSGFVFEILAGGARNFSGKDFAPNGNFRGDFNLGYRF